MAYQSIHLGTKIDEGVTRALELPSNDTGKGASQVGIEDVDGNFPVKNVEAALRHSANIISTHTADLITDSNGAHGFKTEFGTWTPTLTSDAGGEATYSANNYGSYIKHGNLVYVQFDLFTASKGTMAAGGLQLGGLPFAVSGNLAQDTPAPVFGRHSAITYPTNSITLAGLAPRLGNLISLYFLQNNNANFTTAKVADIPTTVDIRGSMIYKAL